MRDFLVDDLYKILEDVEYQSEGSSDEDAGKDSLLIIENYGVIAYELGGVSWWERHPNDAIVYEKYGETKVVEFEAGTVIYDTKEVVEEYYNTF